MSKEKQMFTINQSIKKIDQKLKNLKNDIIEGRIYRTKLWRGADVIISVEEVQNLSWTHKKDIQVITGNKKIALSLSWLFRKISKIMKPLLHFQNKYGFYATLAKKSICNLEKKDSFQESIFLLSILKETQDLLTEGEFINTLYIKDSGINGC